jgi:hypothetical protein
MKAYKATFTNDGENSETVLIGANSLSSAAKKAEDSINSSTKELVMVESTEEVIL